MTPMGAGIIYKLMTRAEWEEAQEEGVYRGSVHDQRDGFIHFSTAAQLGETARKHFSGVADLVLLAVDVEDLKSPPSPQPSPSEHALACSPLKMAISASGYGGEREHSRSQQRPFFPWGQDEGVSLRLEPSRGGDLFPHLYSPLPISTVKTVTAVPLAEDGTPVIPNGIEP